MLLNKHKALTQRIICILFILLYSTLDYCCAGMEPKVSTPQSLYTHATDSAKWNNGLVLAYTSASAGKDREFPFAVKTNLLTTALTWLNLSVEVPFDGNRFSVMGEYQFPWWRGGQNRNKFCMRYLQAGGEFRWWFHPRKKASTGYSIVRNNLCGHFVGIYGMGGKYDFQNKRDICYQGEFWSVGLTYGYSLPVARVLNLEFFVSFGYASIPYRHFIPSEDYSDLFRDPSDCGTWNYFGPTKIGVTLVLPINIKRLAVSGKGGAR